MLLEDCCWNNRSSPPLAVLGSPLRVALVFVDTSSTGPFGIAAMTSPPVLRYHANILNTKYKSLGPLFSLCKTDADGKEPPLLNPVCFISRRRIAHLALLYSLPSFLFFFTHSPTFPSLASALARFPHIIFVLVALIKNTLGLNFLCSIKLNSVSDRVSYMYTFFK